MLKVMKARALDGYRLELVFDNGVRGTANLADLVGKGVFALWNDYEAFKQVRVGLSGEVSWGDVVDLCPHSLYLRAEISRFFGVVLGPYIDGIGVTDYNERNDAVFIRHQEGAAECREPSPPTKRREYAGPS